MQIREMTLEELEARALEYVCEHPESPVAWYLYSYCLLELEKFDEALLAIDILSRLAKSSRKIEEMRKRALEGAVV
jgi:hypothetical protein